jgi:catechol 2,3-dioxygenase-like lactoylglutathione lyase family enzyme
VRWRLWGLSLIFLECLLRPPNRILWKRLQHKHTLYGPADLQTMPRLLRQRLILAVQDLRVSTDFWTATLGFSRDFGDGSDGWSWLSRDGVAVGLGECADQPAAGDLGDHSYVAYITVDDVDALCEDVRARGASIIAGPSTTSWGMREFAVRTPDGHRLTFGAAVRAA